jgi:hypothetical protein
VTQAKRSSIVVNRRTGFGRKRCPDNVGMENDFLDDMTPPRYQEIYPMLKIVVEICRTSQILAVLRRRGHTIRFRSTVWYSIA